MPYHKSCLKVIRRSEKARIRNSKMKSRINTAIKKLRATKSKEAAQKALKAVYSVLDKAVKTNVIHKNNSANKKSALSKIVKNFEK